MKQRAGGQGGGGSLVDSISKQFSWIWRGGEQYLEGGSNQQRIGGNTKLICLMLDFSLSELF